jgi:hypothetical protein
MDRAMKLSRHFTKRRLIGLVIGLVAYCGLWIVTEWKGSPRVGVLAAKGMNVSSSDSWSSTIVYAPFLVHADYGWTRGSLFGESGSALYFWFFGVSYRMYELSHWAS